jgi:hypothetical protein
MSKQEVDQLKYYPTYERPQQPDASVINRIEKLSPAAKCLDQALEELIKEQDHSTNVQWTADDDTQQYDRPGEVTREENIQRDFRINHKFRDEIVESFGTATLDAFHQTIHHDHSSRSDTTEPPAALLHGKLKCYNRYGGQWRIIVSDAELRSRVNIDYRHLKKSENMSLKEMHRTHIEKDNDKSLDFIAAGSNKSGTVSLQLVHDGVFKIDGDLVILACDDL